MTSPGLPSEPGYPVTWRTATLASCGRFWPSWPAAHRLRGARAVDVLMPVGGTWEVPYASQAPGRDNDGQAACLVSAWLAMYGGPEPDDECQPLGTPWFRIA